MITVNNPILKGFYPDPSVCRVGKDYYLVNSSFAFYPGVPVFHSRNLMEWEQIGNVLERCEQLKLKECEHFQGIYAPTIRYHKGLYYMITTNVPDGGNFFVTAKHPGGPWSDPYELGDAAPGIDPSLFFEEDGSCYYVGTRERREGGQYFGDNEIWIQRMNLEAKQLEGDSFAIWHGFMKHSVWPEGPHIYKKDGWYYLIYAESGTEFYHCIGAARSRNLFGPYEGNPANPIFTHRHLGKTYPVTCVGHGELIDDELGNWYMVMLACRPIHGCTMLGRETFLAKVTWEDEWPVVNAGIGHLEYSAAAEGEKYSKCYSLKDKQWPPELLRLRSAGEKIMQLTGEGLRLFMTDVSLRECKTPAFAALRQQHHGFSLSVICSVQADWPEAECAGLAYYQNPDNQIRFEISDTVKKPMIRVISCKAGKEKVICKSYLLVSEQNDRIHLKMIVKGLSVSFYYRGEKEKYWRRAADQVGVEHLSTESAGGFTGCVAGVFAFGGSDSHYADFSNLIYEEVKI